GGGQAFTYQVLNPSLGLQAPTVGNPIGQTSIQGAVTDTSPIGTPEPATFLLLGAGLGVLGLVRRSSPRRANR
ncbi:MAG: PEP-CTERM sorting domain-containing protein, partial [Bryobacteraceae bacterium]